MDFSTYSDRELVELQSKIGAELIARAQVRRAAERAMLRRLPAMV